MKKRMLKSTVLFFAFAAFASSFTSCNKGYGCPSNFSVDKVAVQAASAVASAAAATICE